MPDSQPNYLTVDNNGAVGAEFTGHIRAQGVDLVSGDEQSPPADRKIQWHKDTLDGQVLEEVFGWGAVGEGGTRLQEVLTTLAVSDDDAGVARINLQAGVAGQASGITVLANRILRTLLLDDGSSNFLQLDGVAPVNLHLVTGSVNVVYGGASATSNITTVTPGVTGLSVGPIPGPFGHMMVVSRTPGHPAYAISGVTDATFNVQTQTTDGHIPTAGSTIVVIWWAIGAQ